MLDYKRSSKAGFDDETSGSRPNLPNKRKPEFRAESLLEHNYNRPSESSEQRTMLAQAGKGLEKKRFR